MKKADIVRTYLDDHLQDLKDGKISIRKLSELIYKDNPGVWNNKELARNSVRSIIGSLKGRTKKTHPFKSSVEQGQKYLTLPESQANPLPDFIFPTELQRTFCFSDVHIPYHSEKAIVGAVEFAKTQNIDSILINGDLFDFYQGSDFCKDPRNFSLEKELQMGYDFISWLMQEFQVPVYYKLGNHEFRWERMLLKNVPQITGIPEFQLGNLLQLRDFGIEVIEQDRLIKYGKLNIIHGHEFKQSFFNPVNPARGLFLRSKSSTLAGHLHQTSEHHESNMNETAIGCFSIGCLCDLRPEYSRFAYTKWNHGFAILHKKDDGKFHVDNRRIINDAVI